MGEQRNYSDDVAKQIDDEVRGIIDRAYERATEVLTTHQHRLTELAEALVAKETLEAAEFEALFADMPEPRNEPGGSPTPKLATPLAGLSKPDADEPPAAAETPEPTPQPA